MKKLAIRGREGFSLVEVSLALLVIGLGLLAVFSLFPSGLTMNKNAIDETQAAVSANDSLDAYRGLFEADPNLLHLMTPLSSPPYARAPQLGAAAGSAWTNYGAAVTVKATRVTNPWPWSTCIYINDGWASGPGRVEKAFRSRRTMDDVAGKNGRIKYAHMDVLNGQYGPLNSRVDFYTEYYDFRSPRNP